MLAVLIIGSIFSFVLVPLHLQQTFFYLKRSPHAFHLIVTLSIFYWLFSLVYARSFLVVLYLFLHYLLAIGDSYYHVLSPAILKILFLLVLVTNLPIVPSRLAIALSFYGLFSFINHINHRIFLGAGDLKLLFIWFFLLSYWQLYWAFLLAITTCFVYMLLLRLPAKTPVAFTPFLFIGLLFVL